jgi:hypothetical protein
MAQTIKIPNYNSPNLRENTSLRTDAAAAALQLDVENSNNFTAPQYAVLGELGGEESEVILLGNPSDVQHISVTGGTKFAHKGGEPIRLLFGTTLKLYRAPDLDGTAPTPDKFSPLGTIDLDADDQQTIYTDDAGGSGYWYRFTYVGVNGETNLEDCPAVRGGNAGSYTSLDAVRQAAGFEHAKYITDQMIAPHRAAAQSFVDSALSGTYVVPFQDPINPQIELITKTLAAGYLLKDQYPSQPARGDDKVKWAEAELAKYQNGTMTLLNTVGVVQAVDAAVLGEHWPNEQTPETPRDDGGSTRYFRMDDVRNDFDRRY